MKIKYRGKQYDDFIIKYIDGQPYTIKIIRPTKGDINTSPERVEIIDQALEQHNKRLVEEIEKRKWLDKDFGKEAIDEYHEGYNHALDDIINLIPPLSEE